MIKINKIKNSILLCSLLVASSSYAQISQNWPVHDSATYENIKSLHTSFENVVNAIKAQSSFDKKNTIVSGVNNVTAGINDDIKNVAKRAAPTLEKCIAITKSTGMGRANAVSTYNQKVLSKNVAQARGAFGNSNFNNVIQSMGELGTCKEIDVKDGVKGCEKIGDFAGMDENTDTLSGNIINGNKSITSDQAKVGLQLIKNFVFSGAPTRMTGGRSANSSLYQTQLKQWHTRVSPVANALRNELGYNTEIEVSPNSSLGKLWNSDDFTAAYTQMNGSAKPKNPSMNELLTTMINKDLFYGNDVAKRGSASQVDLLRNIDSKLALNNKMMLRLSDLLSDLNKQLGALTMNSYAPVTNDISETAQTGN